MRVDGSLARARLVIGGIDHALLLLLGARGRLAAHAGRCKRHAGVPLADAAREARVHARAAAVAGHIGLSVVAAQELATLAIADARRVQGLPADATPNATAVPPTGNAPAMSDTVSPYANVRLLRLLPPPARYAPLLRLMPARLQQHLLERALAAVLAAPVAEGSLDFLGERRLGIEVSDLGLRWVIALQAGRLRAVSGDADAWVRGTATDLLLLAGRLEDADTLFFQRRLILTGDTELGLTVRNTLDRLPWASIPLALRIPLHRGALLARAARAAHHGTQA